MVPQSVKGISKKLESVISSDSEGGDDVDIYIQLRSLRSIRLELVAEHRRLTHVLQQADSPDAGVSFMLS